MVIGTGEGKERSEPKQPEIAAHPHTWGLIQGLDELRGRDLRGLEGDNRNLSLSVGWGMGMLRCECMGIIDGKWKSDSG